jgi:hypothetical protein
VNFEPASAELVTEADPDAPLRQGRRLEDGDSEAEQRVMRDVWRLVRAGALDDAQSLCRAAGMPWLAAAIGARLWDDPQLRTSPCFLVVVYLSIACLLQIELLSLGRTCSRRVK